MPFSNDIITKLQTKLLSKMQISLNLGCVYELQMSHTVEIKGFALTDAAKVARVQFSHNKLMFSSRYLQSVWAKTMTTLEHLSMVLTRTQTLPITLQLEGKYSVTDKEMNMNDIVYHMMSLFPCSFNYI